MWSRLLSLSVLFLGLEISPAVAMEQLVIATSPSMRIPVEALGRQFEQTHPDVRVRLYFDSGLDIRRTIAGMENSPIGQYFIGSGPIHLVAPGGDELITRLEVKILRPAWNEAALCGGTVGHGRARGAGRCSDVV